jgi:hypothetical protein
MGTPLSDPLSVSFSMSGNPRAGYGLALANMLVSGAAIYVNSIGVRMFTDSTVYTAGKNLVVAEALLAPLVFSPQKRAVYHRLARREWALLLIEDRADEGLRQLVLKFDGALPYLRLIAHANGVSDPFDRRVVEAY